MGLPDQEVHEADDGGLIGEVAGVGEPIVARFGGRPKLSVQVPYELDHRLRRRVGAPDALEQFLP